MDFLKDCMNDVGNPPIDVMHKNWCLGCGNRGCERAGMNNSAFDKRVKNWRETLFLNVPRAAPDDPAYDNIRSKSFTPVGQPKAPRSVLFTPGVSTVSVPVPMAKPAAFVRQEPESSGQGTAEPVPTEPVPTEPVPTEPEKAEKAEPEGRAPPPGNTSFEQGTVLGGGPAPADQRVSPEPPPAQGPGKTFILEDD